MNVFLWIFGILALIYIWVFLSTKKDKKKERKEIENYDVDTLKQSYIDTLDSCVSLKWELLRRESGESRFRTNNPYKDNRDWEVKQKLEQEKKRLIIRAEKLKELNASIDSLTLIPDKDLENAVAEINKKYEERKEEEQQKRAERFKNMTASEQAAFLNSLAEDLKYKSEPQKEKSVVGQAVAGGIIAGPAGAVVGAINAADKNNKIRAEKASKQ